MKKDFPLPKPYEEVFIWVDGVRRVARLNHSGLHFQLATFLADTKSQYLVSVSDIDRWSPIEQSRSHEALTASLEQWKKILQLGAANAKVACPQCARLVKKTGLADHMRDVHSSTPDALVGRVEMIQALRAIATDCQMKPATMIKIAREALSAAHVQP